MEGFTPDFSVDVEAVKGFCPAGETYAKQQVAAGTIPVLTCEGPCIRGDIARLAGNYITDTEPSLARCCHAEAFYVPHSTMAAWVKGADKVIMIDGCFLKCHGRVLRKMVDPQKVVHIDALPLYKKYTDLFSMDDVPEAERKAVARDVAAKIVERLHEGDVLPVAM